MAAADPLPSWNDGAAKKALVDFVKTTTDKSSPNFVPPEARIATFDQDGTTWVEQPMYSQFLFVSIASTSLLRSTRNGKRKCRSRLCSAVTK